MESNPLITIAICTYNRADLLKLALDSLVNQDYDRTQFEVIVINNNSTDNTLKICKKYESDFSNYKIITETKQGLSHARNRAYNELSTDYIAYIDDDAQAPENYIEKAIRIIKEHKPDAFGGPIYPFYLSPKPDWFKDEYEIRMHHPKTGWFTKGSISGSNMIFKKTMLQKLGGFDPDLGMRGEEIKYGEESFLIQKALQNNYKFYYDTDLIIKHFVPEYKMHLPYFLHRYLNSGKTFTKSDNISNTTKKLYKNINEINQIIELIAFETNEEVQKIKSGGKTNETFIIEKVFKRFHKLAQLDSENQIIINSQKSIIEKILTFNLEKILNRLCRNKNKSL